MDTQQALASLLECPLCLSTFVSPICTPCGHTFCSTCLSRSLNASTPPVCPLCRAPCYMQPSYNGKPVVVLEKIIALAFPAADRQGEREQARVEFHLDLFLCDEEGFTPIPNRRIKIHAFEPQVVLLMNRCAQNGTRFGLQTKLEDKRGMLIRVDAITPLHNSRELLADCFTEAVYEIVGPDAPTREETCPFPLYSVLAKELDCDVDAGGEETKVLANKCKDMFETKLRAVGPSVASLVFQDTYSRQVVHVLPRVEDASQLSYFLLDVLAVEEDMRFEPSVRARLEYCARAMERGVGFKVEQPGRRRRHGLFYTADRTALEFSRNALFATGWLVLIGVAMGGFESIIQSMRRQ